MLSVVVESDLQRAGPSAAPSGAPDTQGGLAGPQGACCVFLPLEGQTLNVPQVISS